MKVIKPGSDVTSATNNNPVQSKFCGVFGNVLVNGDFSVNQRNTTGATTKSSVVLSDYNDRSYVADRWIMRTSGPDVGTIRATTQATSCLSAYRNSGRMEVVSNGSDTDGFMAMRQYIVGGENFLHKGHWTVSFWVKTDMPTITITVAGGTITIPVTHYSATLPMMVDGWVYVTKTFNLEESPANTVRSLEISAPVTANSAGYAIEVCDVKLESGTVATPFNYRLEAEELALCKREFQKSDNNFGFTLVENNNSFLGRMYFSAEMRTIPEVEIVDGTGLIYGPDSGVTPITLESKTYIVNQISSLGFRVKVNNITEISNCGYMNSWAWTADTKI